jgi:Fic-DOC domain mobile mystery protein B
MSETDLFQEPNDATPLDPALRDDLIQTWVTTRADLNEAEEENILKGAAWARRRRGGTEALLNEDFSKNLHKQMFGEVWKWAGKYRQNELNIGIAPHLVAAEMPVMFDNTRFWVENKTFQLDEIAVRLHHRLTQIHGFPNGNGRHGRMTADLLMKLKRILCGRGHPEIDFGSRRQDDRHCFGMDNADLLVGFDREQSEDIIRRLPFLDLSHGRPVGPEPGKEGERPCLIESKPHRRLAPVRQGLVLAEARERHHAAVFDAEPTPPVR